MATVNQGRVGFVPKGEYNPSTQYVKFDTVTYGSNTYVAWATVTGVTPGTDETKWKLLVNNNVDIEELKSWLNIINGSDNSAELNPAINNRAINGATATFNNGELLMYGKAAGVRWLLCLGNQDTIRSSTGTFSETVGKGTYIAKIKVRGYKTTEQVASYTYDTFANRTDIKEVFDSAPTENSVNPVTSAGIYNSLLTECLKSSNNVPALADNTDFDSLHDSYTYRVSNNTHANTMLNIPEKVSGKLFVVTSASALRQYQIYITDTSNTRIYFRQYNGNVWSTWKQNITNAEFDSVKNNVSTLSKSLKIKYEYGSWSTFTELFSVYVPTLAGYIRFGFRHYVVEEKNCNCNVRCIYPGDLIFRAVIYTVTK